MVTKKQILFPVLVLGLGVAGFMGMSALKQPPEEKEQLDTTPLVSIQANDIKSMTFSVSSYGVAKAKYETELVAQVNGEIVYLSDRFMRGGFVKKGEVLAKIDSSDYDAAMIDARANLASAKASLVQERAVGQVAKEQWSRIKNSTPTDLGLRKPQLEQELARLESSKAGLKRAKRNLERTIIKAPYDALIASRSIGLGSYVSTGIPVGKVLSTSDAEIRLPVADKDIKYLEKQGKGAVVVLEGEFAGKKQQWSGKIVRSEGVIDSRSRMTYLVAEVADPYGLLSKRNELRFGTYVTASIKGSDAGKVSVVPRHLIVDGQVAVVDNENKLRFQTVNVIRQVGAEVIISDGLSQGMQVITSALDFPVEGMLLAVPGNIALPTGGDPAVKHVLVAMGDKG